MLKHIAWLDCFVYCKFLKLLGHIMVLLVLAIVGFTWWAMAAAYGPRVLADRSAAGRFGSALLLLVFTLLVVMLTWAYFAALATDPGSVPPGWHPFPDDVTAARELDLMQGSSGDFFIDRRDPRRPRFCKHCRGWKPERAHHCSVMGRCVLKMDHYCIWVVNCVGLMNYKFFLQFLGYTFVASLVALAALIQPMLAFFSGSPGGSTAVYFIAVVINSAFVVSLAGFLIMHANMLAANCTTIEMYEKERIHPWPYNRGFRRNAEDVFGRSKLSWLLPRHSSEERRALLDSCLNTRLLANYLSSSSSADGGGSGGRGGGARGTNIV